MSKDENIGTRSAGTEEKEVIVSKLSDLVVGVWKKASDKFRTNADAEAKDAVVDAALTDLDSRLNSVSGDVEDKADLDHSHGFITNEGTINGAATIASGDHLVITDVSELGKIKQSVIAFDGVSADKALTKAGTWETMLGSAAITNAINALDVSSVGGSGKYISQISETDGKISATATSFDSTPTSGSSNAVTSSGIKTALDAKASKTLDNVTGTLSVANGGTGQTSLTNVTVGAATKATVADSVSTAIGNGEIRLLGVANNVAGNYQPKMHANIRAYYQNGDLGNILMIGPERGTRGAPDRGGIRLSGGTGYFTQLQTADFTADRWHKLPDESGNLAVTSGNYPNMSVGTADYASAAKSGSALAQAIAPDADVALIVYGDATYSSVKALYNSGKKLYLVTGGSIQPSGKFEYRIPLTQITYDANSEVNAFYFEVSQDDRNGASEVGSIAVYRLDSSGWTNTPKQVGYATNAGHAADADTATNATNDQGGAKIRDTYLTRVDITQSAGTASDYIVGVGSIVANVDQNGFRYTTVNTYTQPVSNVYLKTMPGLTALKPDGTAFSDNLLHVQNTDTSSTYYSDGFICIGHENPSNKLYGIGVTDAGYVEVDFDFTAYFSGYGGMKDKIDLIFALVWGNNTRFYTLPHAAGTPLVPTNIISTARVSVPYQTTYESYGHCYMSGLLSGAGERRLYVGVYQNMWYGSGSLADVLFQVSNIRVKWTRPVQGHG